MGHARKPQPVKLFIGIIFQNQTIFNQAKNLCVKKFGKIDFESSLIPFTQTNYYEKEMGKELTKVFLSFSKLILPNKLSRIKIITNSLEAKLSKKGLRKINIDPGYLDLAKVILASTKDYYHRIYLDKGIFAELTLSYRAKTFQPMEWTYLDYRTERYIQIFKNIREIYTTQIKPS